MFKMFCLFGFQMIVLSSCHPSKVQLSDLIYTDFKYYKKGSDHLFTGTAIAIFENGNISNTIELKDGIPNGKWVAYGYKGEIIQEGYYTPITISEGDLFIKKTVQRINVCFGREGSYSSTIIYVISDTSRLYVDTINLRNRISQLLTKERSLSVEETGYQFKIIANELNSF